MGISQGTIEYYDHAHTQITIEVMTCIMTGIFPSAKQNLTQKVHKLCLALSIGYC